MSKEVTAAIIGGIALIISATIGYLAAVKPNQDTINATMRAESTLTAASFQTEDAKITKTPTITTTITPSPSKTFTQTPTTASASTNSVTSTPSATYTDTNDSYIQTEGKFIEISKVYQEKSIIFWLNPNRYLDFSNFQFSVIDIRNGFAQIKFNILIPKELVNSVIYKNPTIIGSNVVGYQLLDDGSLLPAILLPNSPEGINPKYLSNSVVSNTEYCLFEFEGWIDETTLSARD